jgi:iron complex transport system ATP-binding protein
MDKEKTMLKAAEIEFSYDTTPLFSKVSFHVEKGRLCGLFGPNGSGKTTLFKCCLGLLKAKGNITIAGREHSKISTAAMAKLVAYVPQDHSSPFPFLVREVVLMGRAPHFGGVFGITKEDRERTEEAMARLGLSKIADKPYTNISGGQRQLVLIARALAQDTPLIMLDEPTSSLDFKNQIMIWKILREIVESGKTVFACAHDPNHVSWFCDHVLVMGRGGLMAKGDPSSILDEPLLTRLYGEICGIGTISGLRMVYPK